MSKELGGAARMTDATAQRRLQAIRGRVNHRLSNGALDVGMLLRHATDDAEWLLARLEALEADYRALEEASQIEHGQLAACARERDEARRAIEIMGRGWLGEVEAGRTGAGRSTSPPPATRSRHSVEQQLHEIAYALGKIADAISLLVIAVIVAAWILKK